VFENSNGHKRKPSTERPLNMLEVFSTGQVARICRASQRTVTAWIDSGQLAGYRLPRGRPSPMPTSDSRRVTRTALVAFMRAHGIPLNVLETASILTVGTGAGLCASLAELLPGWAFYPAHTGFEAGVLAEQLHHDTVVIDCLLGRSEALGVCVSLRRNPTHAGTLIIALANEDEDCPLSLTEAGFDEVLKRPFDVALLAERIAARKASAT
jgi:two-component system, OmpR family, response regulator RpaA